MYILRSKNVPGHRRASSQNLPFQKEIIALLKEVQIRERGYISASGFGPGGPNLLADMDRGVQIRCYTGSDWNLEILVFMTGKNLDYPEKNPRGKDENRQQTHDAVFEPRHTGESCMGKFTRMC